MNLAAASRPANPTVAWRELDALARQARSDGVDIDAILERYAIPQKSGRRGADALALLDYFKIERDIARSLDDLTAHLSTRKLTYRTGEFVMRQIGQSPTLAQAMVKLCDYFNMMHAGQYNTVQESKKTITISIDDRNFPYTMSHAPEQVLFTGECVQIKVHCLLDSLSNGLAAQALTRVGIVREPQGEAPDHLSFWTRSPLLGQSVYTLTYNLKLAKQSIPAPDDLDLSSAGVLSRAISQLERTTTTHRRLGIQERVGTLFEEGITDQEQVASHLNTSVATMRRRLTEAGTSFRKLLSDHRIRVAEDGLQRQHSIRQITEDLGYSDIRAFNRAFKRAKGITPHEYSRQLTRKGERKSSH
ncbi:MAG: helix-turn-helix transcriptional regulator [Henriciella sp.]|nr:helix-turn-helix transcriptional regulator [Henriciella sp.]